MTVFPVQGKLIELMTITNIQAPAHVATITQILASSFHSTT